VRPRVSGVSGASPVRYNDWNTAYQIYSQAYVEGRVEVVVEPGSIYDRSMRPSGEHSKIPTRNVSDSSKLWDLVDPITDEDWDAAEQLMRTHDGRTLSEKWSGALA
jgi:hypothetical protein